MRSLIYLFIFLAPLLRLVHCQASLTRTYDFIIVGGGTAGLVIANRLSENGVNNVLVVEAGQSELDNTNSTYPDRGGNMFNTRVDWAYQSVPQQYTGRYETEFLTAGKGIGGSSLINGMVYLRAEAAQIDAWESLGNKGWNWESLFKYYKKSEKLHLPSEVQRQSGAVYDPGFHGFDGKVNIGWPDILQVNDYHQAAAAAFGQVGVPENDDVNGGQMRGFNIFPKEISVNGDIRSDAARSYFYPVQKRPNLFIMSKTLGLRLIWNETNGPQDAVAGGVEVLDPQGNKHNITANIEVIVSCGSYRSAPFLEHSGIGNPEILANHGIPTTVALPSVGENLQDQTQDRIVFSAPPSENSTYAGASDAVAYVDIEDLLGIANTASLKQDTKKQLSDWAAQIAAINNNASSEASILHLLQIQHDLLFKKGITAMEFLQNPSASTNGILNVTAPTISFEFWTTMPFGRGNVHIASPDPTVYPAINNNFFMFPIDTLTQVAGANFIRKLFATAPLASRVTDEVLPGLGSVAKDASDDAWGTWLKGNYRTTYHPIGSCSMMPREKGGVVSARTLVYGTKNVRVVDASILPLQVNGHVSSTVYAVAEKAADLIRRITA